MQQRSLRTLLSTAVGPVFWSGDGKNATSYPAEFRRETLTPMRSEGGRRRRR
jgi:hypothetical protein